MIIFVSLFFLLIGCGKQQFDNESDQNNPPLSRLSTNPNTNQSIAKEIERTLASDETFTAITAIISDKTILITPEVRQFKRFQLKSIRKQLKDKVKEGYPDFKVVISTDKKIIHELKLLKEKVQAGTLSEKEFNKQFKKIISLTKENT